MLLTCFHFSYKHALDGVMRVAREEGILKLFNGAQWASSRAVMVTVGQLCFYDVIKAYLLTTPYFQDNLTTHFTSSLGAVSIFSCRVWPLVTSEAIFDTLCFPTCFEVGLYLGKYYALYRVRWQNSLGERLLMASNCFATNHLQSVCLDSLSNILNLYKMNSSLG